MDGERWSIYSEDGTRLDEHWPPGAPVQGTPGVPHPRRLLPGCRVCGAPAKAHLGAVTPWDVTFAPEGLAWLV